jgi:hypothetical protein
MLLETDLARVKQKRAVQMCSPLFCFNNEAGRGNHRLPGHENTRWDVQSKSLRFEDLVCRELRDRDYKCRGVNACDVGGD